MSSLPIHFSAKARRTREQPINYLIAAAKANPSLISFAAGLVDPTTLPTEEVREITQRLLSDPSRGREVLQYGTSVGHLGLREAIVKHLEALEGTSAASMSITPDNVVIATGSQQLLYILADILLDPGDIVIIEAPSYFVYAGALSSFGANILSVPMDRDGMVVDELEKLLHRLKLHGSLPRVKAVYCQSYFQNPTGLTISLDRRRRLAEIVRKYSSDHRIVIVEDAAYRELRYDGEDIASIKRFDAANEFVVSCYTFDKPFAAGIKVGFAIGPGEIMRQVVEQKGNHDFGSSNLTQHIAYEAMVNDTYAHHLAAVKSGYIRKRDLMLRALERHLPTNDASVQWTNPRGGLYVWLSLPRHVDTSKSGGMFDDCLKRGVLYVPGEYCFQPDEAGHVPQNHMRLCYAVTPVDQIEPGIERLAAAIKARLK